jgi:hypothetical protein
MVRVTGLPVSVNVLASASDIGATSAVTANAAMAFLIFKVSSMRIKWVLSKREANFQA